MSLFTNPYIHKYRPFNPNLSPRDDIGVIEKRISRYTTRETWGPRVWYYIHNTTAHYVLHPEKYTPDQMYDWVWLVERLVKCIGCQNGYVRTLRRTTDLYTICSIPSELFEFMVRFHNHVNTKLQKPVVLLENVQAYFGLL